MILAGTGHRPNKLGNEWAYDGPVTKAVQDETVSVLKHLKPSLVISGMALGFDTILALCALSEGIPLEAAIPFEGQESRWSPDHQGLYRWVLAQPGVSQVVVGGPGTVGSQMYVRNCYMVDKCDGLLVCSDGSMGGTANCVAYAEQKKKPIYRLTKWLVAVPAGRSHD